MHSQENYPNKYNHSYRRDNRQTNHTLTLLKLIRQYSRTMSRMPVRLSEGTGGTPSGLIQVLFFIFPLELLRRFSVIRHRGNSVRLSEGTGGTTAGPETIPNETPSPHLQ